MTNVFLENIRFCSRLVLGLLAIVCFVQPQAAYSQRCDTDEEAIFKLHRPAIGAYAIWYGVHGDEIAQERYIAGVLNDKNNIIVVGERMLKGDPFPTLVLSEIDRRGRVVVDFKRKVDRLHQVLNIKRSGENIVVTALLTDKRKDPKKSGSEDERLVFWVGLFKQDGAFIRDARFRSKSGSPVIFGDVLAEDNGKAFVMVLETRDAQSGATRISEFYRLNRNLKVSSWRSYNPGPDNGFHGIVPMKDGNYMISGYIDNARNRKTGWLLKVDPNGGIIWQRSYPRGIGAKLAKTAEMPDGKIVAVGVALPAQENSLKAGWLMSLQPDNGELIWQRYFSGKVDYSAKDLIISEDGLISVMLDSKPVAGVVDAEDDTTRDYVRLVTMNPRGVIFDSQAYYQGQVADAGAMILGPKDERIIIGHTEILYQKESVDDVMSGDDTMQKNKSDTEIESFVRSDEGWIVAAPQVSEYEDPCKPKVVRVLGDRDL